MAKDKVFVAVDADHTVTAFYPESIYADQPAGTVSIDFDAYAELLGATAQGKLKKVYPDGTHALVDPPAPPLSDVCGAQCKRIDDAADAARLAVAGDPLRAAEYQIAEVEAKAFRDAGYSGTVPQSVLSWSEAKQWTPQVAADDILTVAAAWNGALYAIRDVRLKAKEAVRAANTAEAAAALTDSAVAQINALVDALRAAG